MSTNQPDTRERCVKIVDHILDFSKKFVKHQTIMGWVYGIFQPRIKKIILEEATDADIKEVIFFVKREIDELYKQVDIVTELKESEKLNSPEINEAVKKLPNYEKILRAWS